MKRIVDLQVLVIVVCIFSLGIGCNKAKSKMEPLVSTQEVKEQEEVQPVQKQPEAEDLPTPESQIKENEFDQKLEANKYPGIEGEFFESSMLKDVFFAFDRADLSAQAREILSENATFLKNNPKIKVQIEGHCDERGSTSYNLALGERRASSVKNYLTSLGISADRLSTISFGEEMPVDPRHNEEAWAKNRRCHMIIQEK